MVSQITYKLPEAPLQIDATLQEFGQQLAQHVAGMEPQSIKEFLEQPFLFDSSMSVDDKIKQMARDVDEVQSIQILDVCRFQCGEVIQLTAEQDDQTEIGRSAEKKRAFA